MNYNRITISVLLLFLSIHVGLAQQDPHFSLYKYNMNVINPAFAGVGEGAEVTFGARSQWTGIEDAPETYNFNANTPLNRGVGLGVSVIHDRVFVQSETNVYADFSYRIQLSNTADLYGGIKAGGTFFDAALDELGLQNDPLFASNVNQFNPNFGVGLYLKATHYFLTLSAPTLLKNERFLNEDDDLSTSGDTVHYFLGGGYNFYFRNRQWVFKPLVLLKVTAAAPLSLDITPTMWFRENLEFGVNYRFGESYTAFITTGIWNDKLRFGYAFENTTSRLQRFGGSSHEIVLKFSM